MRTGQRVVLDELVDFAGTARSGLYEIDQVVSNERGDYVVAFPDDISPQQCRELEEDESSFCFDVDQFFYVLP